MRKNLRVVLAAVLLLTIAQIAAAAVDTKFYGYQWLRYENKVVGAEIDNIVDTSQILIPRTYLRWKIANADEGYEGNLTLDINMTQYGQVVNTKALTSTATDVQGGVDWASWLKYAYVDLNKVPVLESIDAQLRFGMQKVYFGTIDTWEYPVIDKEVIDRNSIVSSADLGAALVGRIPAGFGSYELAVYNGSGYKKLDTNVEKMYMGSLLITPLPGIYVRGSYAHNITSAINAKPTLDWNATAIVLGYASGPIEGWTEYATRFDVSKASATASGCLVAWSSYLGVKVTDDVQVCGMWMQTNPDTQKAADDRNIFQGGVNVNLGSKAVMLQLDYEIDQLKMADNSSATKGNTMNDTATANLNYWTAQIKWSW